MNTVNGTQNFLKKIIKILAKPTFILARLNNNFGVGFRDHEESDSDLGSGFFGL